MSRVSSTRGMVMSQVVATSVVHEPCVIKGRNFGTITTLRETLSCGHVHVRGLDDSNRWLLGWYSKGDIVVKKRSCPECESVLNHVEGNHEHTPTRLKRSRQRSKQ